MEDTRKMFLTIIILKAFSPSRFKLLHELNSLTSLNDMNLAMCIWQPAVSSLYMHEDQSHLHFWFTFSKRRNKASSLFIFLLISLSTTTFLLCSNSSYVTDFRVAALKIHWIEFTSSQVTVLMWNHEVLFVCSCESIINMCLFCNLWIHYQILWIQDTCVYKTKHLILLWFVNPQIKSSAWVSIAKRYVWEKR